MTDYDINDDDLPTFSPRDVMRRLAELDRHAVDDRDALRAEIADVRNVLTVKIGSVWDHLIAWGMGEEPPTPTAPDEDTHLQSEAHQMNAWQEVIAAGNSDGWRTARRKAVALGLAAPADRAVCEVTDDLKKAIDSILNLLGKHDYVKVVRNGTMHRRLNDAAAHWRGAEAGKEAE